MDTHKSKPCPGVRAFLKEYAIIVIGVLTALGAGQVMEWLHWQQLAREARAAVTLDHKRLLEMIGETDVTSACVSNRLGDLRRILDRAEETGRLPPLGDISKPADQAWVMRGWEGVVNGQTLPHLKPGEGARYTVQATRLDFLRKVRDEQLENWAVLMTMNGPGRRLSDAEAASLRATLGRATAEARSMRIHADALGTQIIDSGLLTQPEVDAAWKRGADRLPGIPICRPLGTFTSESLDMPSLTRPAAAPHEHYDQKDGPFALSTDR